MYGGISDKRRRVWGLLQYLIRWERLFERGIVAAYGLSGREEPGVKIGLYEAGFLSTRFICSFALGRLTVDCECLATVDIAGETDEPRWLDALATVRLAILLLRGELGEDEWLPNDPEATVRVHATPRGVSFEVFDGQGKACLLENGWDGLLRLLEQRTANDGFTMLRV